MTTTAPAGTPAGGMDTNRGRAWLVTGLVVAVVLLIGSAGATVSWIGVGRTSSFGAVGSGYSHMGGSGGMMRGRVATSVPALPGTTVQVTAVDMGAMMGGTGPMRLVLDRATAPAGTVSLVLANSGNRPHELLVLPLSDDQRAGTRPVRSDGTVDESGSVTEASRSGASGTGDGIAPGTAGWTSVDLPAGRYELLCNLPGHYAAGMFAELTVS